MIAHGGEYRAVAGERRDSDGRILVTYTSENENGVYSFTLSWSPGTVCCIGDKVIVEGSSFVTKIPGFFVKT